MSVGVVLELLVSEKSWLLRVKKEREYRGEKAGWSLLITGCKANRNAEASKVESAT
jgi:hypothetical protein